MKRACILMLAVVASVLSVQSATSAPGIHIVKFVNGQDANSPPGPQVPAGSTVTFTYVVTNIGNVPLANVVVTDDRLGSIPSFTGDTNGNGLLDLTETWTYTATVTALAGQQTNVGTVTGNDVNPPGTQVTDADPANYFGVLPALICSSYVVGQIGATIVVGTTDIGNHGDDTVTTIVLPFPFTLYDQTFMSVNLGANGNAQFTSAATNFTNQCLPWTSHTYTIFPYWDDLFLVNAGFGIFTSISGSAPNRIFNIEWRAQYFPGSGIANFELRLYEGQSRFDIIYGTLTHGNTSATAGVQRDNTNFTQYFCNGSGGTASGGQRYVLGPTYDFNNNGKPDYVLYNASTRQTAIWYMNNSVFAGGAFGPTLPSAWRVVGVADFNGDSNLDYAVFNPSTRQTAIWYLSGVAFLGGAFGPTLPSGWTLVAVGDFNGDCNPDYVLYNASTRQTAVWYMHNNVFAGGAFGPTLPSAWRVVGAADFDRDGKLDYALFNPSTRQSAIWYLSGPNFLYGAFGPTIASGYQLTGTADFNGDGAPDYLLYNASTRQTAIWYMHNNLFAGGAFGPTLPAGWSLVAP